MMLFYEIKKLIQGKLFKGTLILSLLVILGFFCITLSSHGFYTSQGEYQTGLKAAQKLMSQRKELPTLMNEELISNMRRRHQILFSNPENLNEYGDLKETVYGAHWQKYETIYRLWLVSGKKNTVAEMFEVRNHQLNQKLSRKDEFGKPLFSSSEKQRAYQVNKQISKAKTSFYEDGEAWNILLNTAQIPSLCTAILTLIMGSILFSKEEEMNTSALLYTSKLGRTIDIKAKIFAVLLLMTILFLLLQGLFLGLVLMTYSPSGWNTILQYLVQYWLTIVPLTNLQAYGFVIVLGYFGCVFLVCVSMVISRCTHAEYHSMILSLLFLFVPALIPSLFLNPWTMFEGNRQLMSISFQSVLGKPFFQYELQYLISGIWLGVLYPLYRSFHQNSERKGHFCLFLSRFQH